MPRRNLWLCLPPVLACLFDNAITLLHQPLEYWQGEYWRALEAAPHGLWLLRLHPAAFEAAMVAYILFFCFMILYLPRAMAMLVATAVMFGHLCGATTWVADYRPLDGYWINLGICVVAAVVLVGSYQMSQPPEPVREFPPIPDLSLPEPIAERLRHGLEED